MIRGSLITDTSELDSIREDWDALAVHAEIPFGAPAWAEAWWRHQAPARAVLSVVAVHDEARLIGLAPMYTVRRFAVTEARLISGGWSSRLGILCEAGREQEVAAAIAEQLSGAPRPADVIHWEAIDAASEWPELLSASAPGGGYRVREEARRAAPVLFCNPLTYEEWLAAKSSNFRQQMRRKRQKIEKAGATFRPDEPDTLEGDLRDFARLHSVRREDKGGSTAVTPASMRALEEIATKLGGTGRFRVWTVQGPDGEAICAQIFVRAGGVLAFWSTGFDEAWGKFSPGALTLLAAIEEGFGQGATLVDLGGGEATYKDRLADEDRPVTWTTSYRRGRRYLIAWLYRLPGQSARRGAAVLRKRIGPDRLGRLRQRLGR